MTVSIGTNIHVDGEKWEPPQLPELVIGIARPQGVDDSRIRDHLQTVLDRHKYHTVVIKMSTLIRKAMLEGSGMEDLTTEESPGGKRIQSLMKWGDILRQNCGRETVARLAVSNISSLRPSTQQHALNNSQEGVAYILSNFVHPSEVSLLRSVYKQRFFLLGIHAPMQVRREFLITKFRTEGDDHPEEIATKILEIDAGIRPSAGQLSDTSLNINDTFHKADVFVDSHAKNEEGASFVPEIDRWMGLVFGNPFAAPTRDEYGMANAFVAARRSVSLGRSVGAAIMDSNGNILCHGWNEPANPISGGVTSEESNQEHRDHEIGYDSSDVLRIQAITDFLKQLLDSRYDEHYEKLYAVDEVDTSWLRALRSAVKDLPVPGQEQVRMLAAVRLLFSSRLMNLIEFGRAVHAEMAAITSAARLGVSTLGATMYVTTFPCHECSRNVVAAGIRRVVYVEPYGKSLTQELYKTSINVRAQGAGIEEQSKVAFEQFIGIDPSRHGDLFSRVNRKFSLSTVALNPSLRIGQAIAWKPNNSRLRPSIRGYDNDVESGTDYEIARIFAEHSSNSHLKSTLAKLRQVLVEEE